MSLTKDTYEYLLNFADDKTILNMLSTNKRFRDEEFFERIMKKRYPLIVRFKDVNQNWREFYIQTIYYLSKLLEVFQLPYLPTLDFNPKAIYNNLNLDTGHWSIARMLNNYELYYNDSYHTIAYLRNGKYEIDPNLHKGSSMTHAGYIRPSKKEIIIDTFNAFNNRLPKNTENAWLTFKGQYNRSLNGSLFISENKALDFMYDYFVETVEHEIIGLMQKSNLKDDWRDREKFNQRIYDGITIKLYQDEPLRYDFQIMKVNLPK